MCFAHFGVYRTHTAPEETNLSAPKPAIPFLYKLYLFRPTWRLVPLVKPGPFDLAVSGTARAHTSAPRLPWVCLVVLVYWMLILSFSDVQHLGNTGLDGALGERHNQEVDSLHLSPAGDPLLLQTLENVVFLCCLWHMTQLDTLQTPLPLRSWETYFLALTASSFLVSSSWWESWTEGLHYCWFVSKKNIKQPSEYLFHKCSIHTSIGVTFPVTGWLLRRFPYLSFCSEIAKVSGRLWNRSPEFLPPFSEERIKGNVILKADMGKWNQPLHASYFPFLLGRRSTFWCRFQATLLSSDGARNHCDTPGTPPCGFQVRLATKLFLSNNNFFEFSWLNFSWYFSFLSSPFL